jgi:hypothetical protein
MIFDKWLTSYCPFTLLQLHKFLQTRERGALIVNADYRPDKHPDEPAFDWLTFDQLQLTMDQILQESVAFYDPYVHVIVFVFLPSQSGNSMAIWRRKIAVPNNLRLAYQAHIKQAMAALRKDYILHVDEYACLLLVVKCVFNALLV